MTIHIFSQVPGRHRGGRPNPLHAACDDAAHTPAQLRDLLSDPAIVVVVGGTVLTEDYIAGLEEAAAKKAAAKAPK